MEDFKTEKNEEIEEILRTWKEFVKENAQANLSNYIETVLLYICALTGKANDDFLDFINIFAYPKITKEEIEGITNIINSYGTKMYYITPSFFLRMMNSDITKIINGILPDVSISENKGVKISIHYKQEEQDKVRLETFNAIYILTDAVATGFEINSFATSKSKIFISNFKTFINGLLETNDFLMTKDTKKIILKKLNVIDFDKHNNNVQITDKVMSKIKNKFKEYVEPSSCKNFLRWYIQVNLICLWSSNNNISKKMLQFFNIFREYQYSNEQVLAVMKIMKEEDYSCLLPFDFMHFIDQDLLSGTSETRYYISILQKIFIYGVYLNNALSLEAINIIENAINSLKKLCDDNKVKENEMSKQLEESSSKSFIKLYNEIKKLEKNNNNGIFEERKNIIKENDDDLFVNIIDYIVEIGCITEEDAEKYLTMPVMIKDEINVLKKIFKKSVKSADFNMKIKLIKYVQKYVKRFYNENSSRREFIEEVLEELIKQVSLYDSKYVKKIKCNSLTENEQKIELPEIIIYQGSQYIEVVNIEQSLIKDKLMVKDLFSYPVRKNVAFMSSSILKETLMANQISFTKELIQLLENYNVEYCKIVIGGLITFLKDEKISLTLSQIEILLPWADSEEYVDFYVGIIENNFKADKLNCTNEVFKLLYTYKPELFNEIFNSLILKRKHLSKQQIDLLSKWTDYTSKKDYNNFAISNKTKYLNEDQTNYIQSLITDINSNEEDIINCIKVISNKDQIYLILKSIIKSVYEGKNKDVNCLFRIIDDTGVRLNLTYYKLLNDDSLIDMLIDLVKESTKANNNAISVFSLIFDAQRRNLNKAMEFIKKLIDKKPIFANQLIKELILKLRNKKLPKYIEQIVQYANQKQIANLIEKKQNSLSYKDLYNKLNEINNLKSNDNIKLDDYILHIDSIMPDEDICVIDEKINKMFQQRIKEDEFDFEKVIEYIIRNKDFFLHKKVGKFNYAKWFFEGIQKIESEEQLEKLIDNKFIINDIYNNLKPYNDSYVDLKYKNYYAEVYLKEYLINILIMKYYNKEIIAIMLKFVDKLANNQEKDKFFEAKELIEQCYNDESYNTIESIERLNQNLINKLKDPIYKDKYLPYCTFYSPNMIYLLFIVKVCERKYEFATQILHKYLVEEKDYEAVEVIIYEVYKEYGINMIEKIICFDDNFKDLYFEKENYKTKLITQIGKYISRKDAIIMLKFLINNIDDENKKYELIKELLSSINYRKNISLQELEYIKSVIITLNNENYKKELLLKWEHLSKKELKQNEQGV